MSSLMIISMKLHRAIVLSPVFIKVSHFSSISKGMMEALQLNTRAGILKKEQPLVSGRRQAEIIACVYIGSFNLEHPMRVGGFIELLSVLHCFFVMSRREGMEPGFPC